MKKTHLLKTEEETRKLGGQLACAARPGDVIALVGDLGVGKTTLAKAIAAALGITEDVTSPTFTLLCQYETGRLPLYHFDVYRVHEEDELFEIGFQEYLNGEGLCVIEWADLVKALLPPETLWVHLTWDATGTERICTVE
ncbi:MAG: tRNA (adenosine(37)-N6)-threonylcarbamoyltransferase complex ATPase subunit type 1 TsaE [Bacillota bacterium]|jgi:tRNA threonylcarbamoyladenosine biosynthesis protein TsaE|nr:tRNA (adenosine(37)-N6)-threonylcarbamoyltransferase complex ATPase subunit type 1 TsaE [Eubacteriales bacterium]MDI9491867.1 tRNA (adenosine(37)-N6)-threonylcarbamoyltransferase complex ATPase subunit type 1 TsaE [Bacillota bacterium]NLV69613.1 tRNA (adenosine(37)-N6)-threonylcarbamoyltransferase complex ATPase subunit type 1 TsaE [Clostridiales bacterium]HRV34068.1 tRNA (adenosine(37)-N6)-threonylcarbamoyltransferase complex ATPase subunit type 1 TsaE [Anaerovoracaceae bacterium]MDD3537587